MRQDEFQFIPDIFSSWEEEGSLRPAEREVEEGVICKFFFWGGGSW